MKPALPFLAALLLAPPAVLHAEEHLIQPGDDPQAVMEAAAAGDRIVFQPGLHQHFPGKHRALLYVDKSVEIELKEGATLRLADHATQLQAAPEITTDQDAGKKLDDLAVAGEFDLSRPSIFTIVTDTEGRDGKADTFAWGVFHNVDNPQGSTKLGPTESKFNETPHRGVPITGDWQELTQGVKIRFGSQTGHNKGSRWFLTYDGPEAYGIRIGHGRQADYIENVRVTGQGTIDMNAAHNIQPGFLVKNINACVLVHGRVRGVVVDRITMTDTNRSVMCYGEHSGKFLPGGAVTPGESFDAENITIQHTRTLNPNGAAYLLGHPSFRGQLRNVKCNHNYMETAVTAIEPNFNLDGYEVIGNVIKSGGHAIHCWRNSKNGVVADNLRIHDNTGKSVVILGAPAGWEKPEPPRLRNNRNHLSDSGDTSFVAEGAKVIKLAGDMKFTEGPVWLPADKKLVFSDIPNSKWMQWTEDGGVSVYRPSEQANGNILDLEGRLISCQHQARNLVRIEKDGKITVLADKFEGQRFNSPNDVAVRSDGTLWFTDPPWGLTEKGELPGHFVFKLDLKTGKVEAVIKDLAMPNGIVFSPDESRLYVADTGGNARHPDPAFHKLPAGVHCYEVTQDGQLGKKLFTIPEGSDGLKVDAQGNLYTTHDKVKIYDPAGKLLEQIDVPEAPANICFGGDDYKTLFITARTSLYSVRMVNPGVKPAGAIHAGQAAVSYYLIGNSLTWDAVPQRLDGDVQWHVDCGVSLPHIFAKPDQPCVKESTVWPHALRDKQYDVVSVQPHYGSTLAQDVETISNWMKLQTRAVFVVHSGWAFHAKRANEFASLATPDQMAHSPTYLRALVAELRRLHPGREIRQTLAQNLLALIAEDIAAGRAPIKEVVELYRDPIHMTHSHGRYVMHNTMRRALGQPLSAAGFENLNPEVKQYLDGVLALLTTTSEDQSLLQRVLSSEETADRTAIIDKVSEKVLRERLVALLPEIERALKARRGTLQLESQIEEVGGKLICTPSAPQWLYLATGDRGTEIFDVPTAVDMYNGNNPLKGKGGRNEKVTDQWLEHLAGVMTLRRVDLANCAIKGDGLRHISKLTDLQEVNLTLTPVTDDALQHLAGLPELRVLGLASTQCTGTGFTHLKGLKKLESVNFHFTPLNDDGLRAITQVPISDRLWFAHTRFTDAGAAGLSNLTHLRRCGIGSTDEASSGEAVAALGKLPLEDLTLLDNQATPGGLAFAAKIATLCRLDVSHAPAVTDDSLPAVSLMPTLEEFHLGSAQVTDEGLMELAASKSLRKLSLTGLKQVTPAGIERLRKARPELQIEVK